MSATCQGCGTPIPPSKTRAVVRKWCSERCRKSQYSAPCVDCGKPLSGSDGRSPNAPKRCVQCAAAHSGAERKVWTQDAIVTAIREWNRLHGEIPRVCDWDPTHARYLGRHLHPAYLSEPERWPHHHTVMREFGMPGGWARAIRAAGFEPRQRGAIPQRVAA